jgi:saccharopine dehydrogenase-like NADP-dependent oxidoreductase
MRKILVLGAGRSSSSLIQYLLTNSEEQNWTVTIADRNIALTEQKMKGHARGEAVELDINDFPRTTTLIEEADLVISMLPAASHIAIAKTCIQLKTDMVTASYVSNEMLELDEKAKEAGVTIMNEIGVDPGIDHLSAKKVIDDLLAKGAKLVAFETFTGGLVAPEFDNNPWNYKFTWNPRNVVLASAGGAVKFIENGKYKYIPYHRVFRRTELIDIEDYGRFEGYANRDSLKYRKIYGLEDIQTMYRGTLRRPGFCKAWDVFVQLGATDDSYTIENSEKMTYREFINSFLKYSDRDSVELKLMHYLKMDQDDEELMNKLKWLDLFENIRIGIKNATPAQVLQSILERKWNLMENERDMIVMWHKFRYEENGRVKEMQSSMVVEGENSVYTAMSKTVGLPVAICAKLMLNNGISKKGVLIPIEREVYQPILDELATFGITFKEKEVTH